MKRGMAVGLLLGGWAATVFSAANATARPGEGIRVGHMAISPFVDLSATYDSNVFLTEENEQDDFFADLIPGVAVLNRTDTLILKGRVWGQFRRYQDFDENDSDGLGERVGLILGTEEDPRLSVEQKYVRVEDYEAYPRSVDSLNLESQRLELTEDRTERVKRDVFDVGVIAGRPLSDRLRLDVGYGYGFVDYDTRELFDWDEHKVQAEAKMELTDKTSALLTGQYSLQSSDGLPEDSSFYLGRVGLYNRTTAKTALKGGVGFERYNADVQSEAGEDLDETIVNFDLAATWDATPKLRFQASGRNGIQPATQYARNTKELMLFGLGASYSLTDTVLLSAGGSHRRDDYVGSVRVGDEYLEKTRKLYGGRARLDYRPHAKFYELYLEGTYENADDNLEDDYADYEQWRASAGIFVRY